MLCHVVSDSIPICDALISEGYHIRMHCSVKFKGNWPPKMEWSRQEVDDVYKVGHRIASGIDYINSIDHVSSTLNALLYSNKECVFSCKTYFAGYRGNVTTTANNTPNFVYIWNSSVLGSQSNSESATTSNNTGVSFFGVYNSDSTTQTTVNSCKSKIIR